MSVILLVKVLITVGLVCGFALMALAPSRNVKEWVFQALAGVGFSCVIGTLLTLLWLS